MLDPGGQIPVSFQYLMEKLRHGKYVGCLITTSLKDFLLTHNLERAAASRRYWYPSPGPTIGGPMGPGLGVGQYEPTRQCQVLADDSPCPNPSPIQRLRLLTGKNTNRIFQNVALPILRGAAFYNCWHMGFSCFDKCPQKGSHTHPSAAVVSTARAPAVGEDVST